MPETVFHGCYRGKSVPIVWTIDLCPWQFEILFRFVILVMVLFTDLG